MKKIIIIITMVLTMINLAIAQTTIYSYDWETSDEATNNWTGSATWIRDNVHANSGSWSAEWTGGGSQDDTYNLTKNIDGSSYTTCDISTHIFIEVGFDSPDYVCMDWSLDGGSSWNADSGGDTLYCADGDDDTEGSFTKYNATIDSPTNQIRIRYRGYSAGNEEGAADDTNITCSGTSEKTITNFATCGTYTDSDVIYNLTSNILNSVDIHCLNFTGTNVDIQCNNLQIDGDSGGAGSLQYGIVINKTQNTDTNFTISNCVINGWAYGIYTYNASNNNITNITGTDNDQRAISIIAGENITIKHCTLKYNKYGILFLKDSPYLEKQYIWVFDVNASENTNSGIVIDSSNNTIENSTFNNNTFYGINLGGSNNTIRNNVMKSNNGTLPKGGMRVFTTAIDNKIYNNLFNNSVTNIYIDDKSDLNYYNTTNQTGTRIHGGGTNIAGNYWTNSTNDAYSDTCDDTNGDGFCDNPINLSNYVSCEIGTTCGTNYDALPLSPFFENPTGSTCDCPSNENYAIDLTKNCYINDCDNTGYNITFTNTGTTYCNGSIQINYIQEPITSQTMYITEKCNLTMGVT